MKEGGRKDQDAFHADYCAQRLKALGDPSRLRILDLLRHGEMSVGDIAEFLETQVVNVSHHLQILKQTQLVTARREGRFIYYQIHRDLLCAQGTSPHRLDLGCCTLEVPPNAGA